MNMGPCKTSESLPKGAPIALSYPHFYQVFVTVIINIMIMIYMMILNHCP